MPKLLPEYSALLAFAHFVAEWVVTEEFEDSAADFADEACKRLFDLGVVEDYGDRWGYMRKEQTDEQEEP